ncbi:MAG: tRNA dihydrouridine synthase DusB [Bacteroidota bacterium]
MKFSDFIIALAPMEDITDSSFRGICKSFGADMLVSEFVAADALIRNVEKSFRKIQFSASERPFGVQLFGNNPENMALAAKIVEEVQPDFIDLNFGCPVKKIVDKGGGAALLKDIPKMVAITNAVVKKTSIPITAKTRLGWDDKNLVIATVAEQLQDVGVKLLTIHGRTKSQMYKGVADWKLIGEVKNNPKIFIPIIGNGDIDSAEKALEMKTRYGVDGIMIGRAAIGNPWIFREIKDFLNTGKLPLPPAIGELIAIAMQHLVSSINNKGERLAILEMRKHYSGMFRALADFKPFRMKLVTVNTFAEVQEIFGEIKAFYTPNSKLL